MFYSNESLVIHTDFQRLFYRKVLKKSSANRMCVFSSKFKSNVLNGKYIFPYSKYIHWLELYYYSIGSVEWIKQLVKIKDTKQLNLPKKSQASEFLSILFFTYLIFVEARTCKTNLQS